FMSPEQCEGRPMDSRADLYSLGATYYRLLTGKRPYERSESTMQVMYAQCNHPPPDPREFAPEIPEPCRAIVLRAMAKLPAERYQSAREMLHDLQALQNAPDIDRSMLIGPPADQPGTGSTPSYVLTRVISGGSTQSPLSPLSPISPPTGGP